VCGSRRPRLPCSAWKACGLGSALSLTASVGTILSACILADPPAELPTLPVMRPTVVHGAVVPSASRVLGGIPRQFEVPVEILDPSITFEWRVFVDYDPLAPSNAVFAGTSERAASRPSLTTRIISFGNPIPRSDPSLQACHVIEFLVAYSFAGTSSHTPDGRGGDTIVWFYDPIGDLGGCPRYDAGAFGDASAPAADADAGQGP
jgi:hypothetical protein